MQLEVYEAAVYGAATKSSEAPQEPANASQIPKLDAGVALWLMLFVFGGGLLALYYAGVGYFPEVSWQDALTYLALMTIIGGSLLVAYSFLLFVPGVIWSQFLICDSQLKQVLAMDARPWEPCVLSVMRHIIFPFALFMAACHFLLYEDGPAGFVPLGAAASLAAVTTLLGRDLRDGLERKASPTPAGRTAKALINEQLAVSFFHLPLVAVFLCKVFDTRLSREILYVAAVLPLVSCFDLLGWGRRRRAAYGKGLVPDKWSVLCRGLLAFGSAALLSLGALWFFYRIYKGGASQVGEVPLSLLLLCTLVVIVTNLAVSVLFHAYRRSALLASFLAALLLLGAGELLGSEPRATLPAKIMEEFGFGGQNATLVLTEKGGRLLCQQEVPVQFEERKPEKNGETASGVKEGEPASGKTGEGKPGYEGLFARTSGMTILSRLGSEYLLRYEAQNRNITLPKGDVISWATSPKNHEIAIQNGCKRYEATDPAGNASPSIEKAQ